MSDWWEGDISDPIIKDWIKHGGGRGGGGGSGGGGGGGGVGALGSGPASTALGAITDNQSDSLRKRREDLLSGATVNYGNTIPDLYGSAADRINAAAGPFNFNANLNDPELIGLLGRLKSSQRERSIRGRDEFARAGLLGSSTMINNMNNMNSQFGTEVQDVTGQALGGQRAEQLGLYRDDVGFRRNAEMGKLGYMGDIEKMRLNNEYERQNARDQQYMQMIGQLGGFAGDIGYGWLANKYNWLK